MLQEWRDLIMDHTKFSWSHELAPKLSCTHARTYACTRGFLIQCSLFAHARATNPCERGDFWPRSGFGNFDLLLLLAAAAAQIPNEISP